MSSYASGPSKPKQTTERHQQRFSNIGNHVDYPTAKHNLVFVPLIRHLPSVTSWQPYGLETAKTKTKQRSDVLRFACPPQLTEDM